MAMGGMGGAPLPEGDLAALLAGAGAPPPGGGEMAPPMGDPMMDPMMGAMGAPPMMGAGAFPSTDPAAIAEAVAQLLEQMAMQDQQELASQQQMAAAEADPLIQQLLMGAGVQGVGDPAVMGGGDPMAAFAEGAAMPENPDLGMNGGAY